MKYNPFSYSIRDPFSNALYLFPGAGPTELGKRRKMAADEAPWAKDFWEKKRDKQTASGRVLKGTELIECIYRREGFLE